MVKDFACESAAEPGGTARSHRNRLRPPWGQPVRHWETNTIGGPVFGSCAFIMKDELVSYLRMIETQLAGEKCLESVLLAKGVWFEGRTDSYDYEEAAKWKKTFKPKIKECWYNAQTFCVEMYGVLENVRYYEGYVLTRPGISPAKHGWIVMPDCQVVDFTAEAVEVAMAEKGHLVNTRGALYVGLELPIELVVFSRNEADSCEALGHEYFCNAAK